tara:strand:+ start:2035 stop:3531 length:1497 start_codon:yes stop_codon:yes gene_type:complete
MKKRKPTNNQIKRRSFLKKGVAASSIFIIPRHVLGGQGYVSPSDKLCLAAIGSGGKGGSDISNASVNGRENVVALCDVDFSQATETLKKFPKAKLYSDFREMLDEEKDIDAVTISTPDHTHASAALYSMDRQKHVYIQKPLTHNIKEARLLTNLARQKKVVSQMGNQGASNPNVDIMQQWIDSRKIGNISKVHVWTSRPVWPQGIKPPKSNSEMKPKKLNWDLWLGPAKKTDYTPNLHPFNWRGWWQYGTGALGDMGCHLMDIPFKVLNLKYPKDVECSTGTVFTKMWSPEYIPEGCPPSSVVQLSFDSTSKSNSAIKMTWSDGGIKPFHPDLIPSSTDIEDEGVMIIGDKGIISCYDKALNPVLYLKGENPIKKGLHISDMMVEGKVDRAIMAMYQDEFSHQKKWVNACKAGFNSKEHLNLTSSFDFSGPLTESVLLGNVAVRSYLLKHPTKEAMYGRPEWIGRKKLVWDAKNMKITNLEDANQFVTRDYREGWELT